MGSATSFFLSYAHDDDARDEGGGSTLVRSFFEQLRDEVRRRTGQQPGADGSFIDVAMPAGVLWENHLKKAACETAVFVPLMSATYFQREWCGKEWAIFEQRVTTLGGSGARFLPLIWDLHSEPWPSYATWYQHSFDDRNTAELKSAFDDYKEKGLRWLVRFQRHSQYSVSFANVVQKIAERIVAIGKEGSLLPLPLDTARTIQARFAASTSQAPDATATADGDGDPSSAHFVALVARREAIRNAAVQARYGTTRWNWRPFLPQSDEMLWSTVNRVAGEVGLRPIWFDRDTGLLEQIRASESRGQIVLVLVDPRSAQQREHLDRLRELDGSLFRNCSIVVIWSDDPDADPYLRALVREQALERRVISSLVDEVRDPVSFAAQLGALCRKLNEQMAMRRTPLRALPQGLAQAFPVVSATRELR